MATADFFGPGLSGPRWYAVYTNVHQEKQVQERLNFQDFNTFLPLCSRTQRRYRNEVEQPLFAGYIFVRFSLEERLRILTTSGVCRIIGRGSQPEPLADSEIDGLKEASRLKLNLGAHTPLQVGRKVRIKTGPLEGLEGILIRRNKRFRAVIMVDVIASAFAVDVEEYDLEPANSRPQCPPGWPR